MCNFLDTVRVWVTTYHDDLWPFCRRALGSPVAMDPTRICTKKKELKSRQSEICRNEPKVIKEVQKGAHLGTEECKFQFVNRRWNCSTDRRSIKKLLLRGMF